MEENTIYTVKDVTIQLERIFNEGRSVQQVVIDTLKDYKEENFLPQQS